MESLINLPVNLQINLFHVGSNWFFFDLLLECDDNMSTLKFKGKLLVPAAA